MFSSQFRPGPFAQLAMKEAQMGESDKSWGRGRLLGCRTSASKWNGTAVTAQGVTGKTGQRDLLIPVGQAYGFQREKCLCPDSSKSASSKAPHAIHPYGFLWWPVELTLKNGTKWSKYDFALGWYRIKMSSSTWIWQSSWKDTLVLFQGAENN